MEHNCTILRICDQWCIKHECSTSVHVQQCVRDPTLYRELNDLHSGAQFNLAHRYAATLNSLFTTLLFSSGMPFLILLAMSTFALSYWMDKYTCIFTCVYIDCDIIRNLFLPFPKVQPNVPLLLCGICSFLYSASILLQSTSIRQLVGSPGFTVVTSGSFDASCSVRFHARWPGLGSGMEH